MKLAPIVAAFALITAFPALAGGDVEAGEKAFKRCKACHAIVNPEGEVLYKGGRTGPNLYGVVGRVIGSTEYKYGAGLLEAMEAGAIWSEEALTAYVVNPKTWLSDNGYTTKSKMAFKMKTGGEDVAAYLATFSPASVEEIEAEAEPGSEPEGEGTEATE